MREEGRGAEDIGEWQMHLCGVAGFAGRNMSNHHVHQARCAAKDLGTGILQEGLHILAKDGWLQVHPKLVQHLLHTAFMLPKNLHQTEGVLLLEGKKKSAYNARQCTMSLLRPKQLRMLRIMQCCAVRAKAT